MTIIKIQDISIPELDPYSRLSEPELMHLYEPNGGVFIAETPMIIERALEAGYKPESMLVEEDYVNDAADIMKDWDIPVFLAPMDVISKLTGFKLTRGMMAVMRRKPLMSVRDLIGTQRRIAVLEDVMNPTNVGAIFRSAAALGIEAILLTHGCSDPLYRRACRVGMGTAFLIPWTYFEEENSHVSNNNGTDNCHIVKDNETDNCHTVKGNETDNCHTANVDETCNRRAVYDYINELHDYGYKTVAMALRGDSVTIDDPILLEEPKLAIILGTEGEGLRTETIEKSDYTVKIPMAAGVDSLNVAAASAVAFWELTKKKQK